MSPSPDLLRRLDWRFLLPASAAGARRHLVLLGGPPGLAEMARSLGIAEAVSAEDPAGADVLAVLRGAPRPAEAVVRGLRPGAVVYLESGERRTLGAPAAPLRQPLAWLRRCGLTVTGIWAVWPEPEDYSVCLPLMAPGAVPWFARTLLPAPTARERLVEAGLRVGRGGSAALLLTRSFAFVAVAGSGPSHSALLADPRLPPELRRDDLEPVLVTHGSERVLVLPFPRRGTAPAGVLKVSRRAGFNGKTVGEQEALARVRPVLGGDLGAAVPAGGGLFEHGGLAVGIEEYAAGRPLLLTGSRWGTPLRRKISDLRLAASWIAGMHRKTEIQRAPWSEREVAAWIVEPCSAFRRGLAAGGPEEALFAAARSRARELCGRPFPLVLRHRDFTPWNLLRDGGRLRVLDWEGLQPGPPACDLLHFLTHWGELARRAEGPEARLRAFRDTLVAPRPGDPVAAAAAEALATYCEEMRLDRDFLPLLLVHTWVEIALRGGVSRGFDAAYVGVLSEHTAGLFKEAGDARRVA